MRRIHYLEVIEYIDNGKGHVSAICQDEEDLVDEHPEVVLAAVNHDRDVQYQCIESVKKAQCSSCRETDGKHVGGVEIIFARGPSGRHVWVVRDRPEGMTSTRPLLVFEWLPPGTDPILVTV